MDGQTDKWTDGMEKVTYIIQLYTEMGALSKNVQMVQHRHFKFFCFHTNMAGMQIYRNFTKWIAIVD